LASDLLRNTLPVEDRDGRGFLMPLIFTFWFMVAAYVIHVLDESLLGGSFVEKVRQHWWPEYSWTRFFWFNTGYFTVMIASVVAYDLLGGSWVILPLAWSVERLCNGFWHVWWTIHFREYSPGLLTSMLMWMDSYFIVRYRPPDVITAANFWPGALIGLLAAAFLSFYFPLIKGRKTRAGS
jgi:Protein of unknown function with HXXEE motif